MEKEKEKQQFCVLTMALHPEPWQTDIIEKRFSIMEHFTRVICLALVPKFLN